MSQTAAMVLIGLTVLGLGLITVAGVHFIRDVLGAEEHDEESEALGHGGTAH